MASKPPPLLLLLLLLLLLRVIAGAYASSVTPSSTSRIPAARPAAAAAFGSSPTRRPPPSWSMPDRRSLIQSQAGAALLLLGPAALVTTTRPAPAAAAGHTVDYSEFKKSLFNAPPGLLQFPPWMEGEWDASFQFVGADFPSSSVPPPSSKQQQQQQQQQAALIPKDRILADTTLPGFRRLSIAMVPDVGKPHTCRMRFVRREDEGARRVEEDRQFNLKAALESEVGRGAVANVDYNGDRNPNRATINLLPQAAVNAQKIELFCNARAPLPSREPAGSFRYMEDIRQVSISSRLAETTTIGDYRHIWELYRQEDGSVRGFLSTVAYALPQDPLFELGAFAPLVVYFHTLTLSKKSILGEAS